MRKNIFKKAVMALATVVVLAGSIFVAPTTETQAATSKTVYVQFSEESSYDSVAFNFWSWVGMAGTTHMKTGIFTGWNPGPVACDKVTYNLYKTTINVTAESFVESGNGFSVYLGYTDTAEGDKFEVDPAYNNVGMWAGVMDAFTNDEPTICIYVDVINRTVEAVDLPADIPTDAPEEASSSYEADFETLANSNNGMAPTTTAAAANGDSGISQTIIIIAVAIIAIILVVVGLSVVSAKKKASEFDDDED